MKKFNLKMAATVMICGSFLFSSCIGSFGLHSKLVSWNQGIGTKFVNELVYLAFRYSVVILALTPPLSSPFSKFSVRRLCQGVFFV